MNTPNWRWGVVAIGAILALGASLMVRPSGAAAATSLSSGERRFMTEVAKDGTREVELGKLALEKSSSDAVKQAAQRLVDDHSAAGQELTQLATRKGVELPAPAATDRAQKRLSSLSDQAFDRTFVKTLVSDHKKDVAAFRKMSSSAHDPDLKAWVDKTLPTLEEHLKMVEQLQTKIASGQR